MEKIFTSLKLAVLFFTLTSSGFSYWNYPALETYSYPQPASQVTENWYDSPFGIFAIAVENCTTDNEKPVISHNGDQNLSNATGTCDVLFEASATATDNCSVGDPVGSRSDGLALTAAYPVGTTIITWNVTDANNNDATPATQTIVVTDNEDPEIIVGNAILETTDAGVCTASIAIPNASISDNCSGSSLSWSMSGATTASGTNQVGTHTFNLGTTTINYIVTDAAGNTTPGSLTVTIEDDEAPEITLGNAILKTTDAGACTASIAIPDAVFSDNCSGSSLSWSMSGATTASGTNQVGTHTFNLGTTTINYIVTDAAGNTTPGSLTVTVEDNEAPEITLGNAILETTDAGVCTASIAIPNAAFSDNCSGSSLSWSMSGATTASGTNQVGTHTFNLGTTTINYIVTDAAGNTTPGSLTVTVEDNEAPEITLGNAILETTDAGVCTASIAIPNAAFSDNCSGSSLSWSMSGATTASGTNQVGTHTFNLGTTTINYIVTDAAGNTTPGSLTVTIEDDEAPEITLGNAILKTTDAGACTASIAIPNASISDNCSGSSLSWSMSGATTASGTNQVGTHTFNLGTTTINYIVTDAAGNTTPGSLTVTIEDDEAPEITLGNAILKTTDAGACTASIAIPNASISDNCSGSSLSWSMSGATTASGTNQVGTHTFNLGTTTINYIVTDAAGNTTPESLTVNVEDDEKPVITAGADITISNISGQCYAGVSGVQATATDNCGVGNPQGIRSDGEALNSSYPVGTTTIEWTVTDNNGNAATPVIQTVVVEDNEPPVPPQLEDIFWGCEYTFEIPTALDNCDNVITATYSGSNTFTTSGSITWTFTDAAGNSSEVTQNITIDPVGIATVDVQDVLCNGFATGSITVAASGGVAPYTYDWGSLGAGDTKTDLPAGTYSVKAFDANGCETETINVVIEEPDTFVDIQSVTTTAGCYQQNNGTATVQATGGTGSYTYSWSNGQTTQQATGLAPGTHSVVVTDSNGCSKERSFSISQPEELIVSGFLTTETTLYGSATGTATAQVTGGTPNYSFSWSNGQTGQTAQNLTAGTYTVTVTDGNGCTATGVVEVIDSLVGYILPISVCEGDDIIRTSYFEVENGGAIGGTPGYTYEWNFGEGASPSTAVGKGRHKVEYETIGDKIITLTIRDSKGREFEHTVIQYVGGCFANDCGSNDLGLDNYFIGDKNKNKITSENCDTTDEKYIYINFPTNATRYSLQIELIYSVQNLEDNTTQTYKVKDCFFNKAAIPQVAQTFQIDYTCGDIVKIEGIYLTFQNNIQRECGTTDSTNGNGNGNGNGSTPKCFSTNNEATVVSPLYAVAFANELLCFGASNGTITSRASGGQPAYQFRVKNSEGNVVRPYQSENIFNGLPAGLYTVEVIDTEGTVFPSRQVEITQPENPLSLELVNSTDVTCFGGDNGEATVIASGGTPGSSGQYIYSWENIGQTTATATNLTAGTYTVKVLDANGCEISLDVLIGEPAELLANAGPDQVLECGNLSTSLAAVFEPVVEDGEPAPQGTWSIVNGPAGGTIENVNDPNSRFTGNVGTYTLRWTVPCGTTDDVKVSFSSCSTLDFDGINDHVVVGDKFDLPSAFTLEAWVKQSAQKTAGVKTVMSETDLSDPTKGFALVVDNNIPKFRWNGGEVSSNYQIGTDRWYHISVIIGGPDAGLYVDGIKVSTDTPGAPSTSTLPFIIGASYNSSTSVPENYFHGWIEEVRLWNKALTKNQVRFLMNQRLKIGSNPLEGTALPLAAPGPLDYSQDILAYYPLIVSEITNGTTIDKGPNAYHGKMVNITTLQQNTAPLPYISAKNGAWTADDTWLRPAVWDHPNSIGVDGNTFIDWNIVVTNHNITSQAKDITVLGLRSEAGRLTISNPSGPQNELNSGQSLTVTHYLKLMGVIDLVGESQLLQSEGSLLASTSTGYLERDQQGTASSYNYNYWTSPVSPGFNAAYSIKGVMKDGTITTFRDLSFGNQYHFADGPYTNPRRVSNYWLHKFHGTANNYFSWNHIGSTGTLKVGEGYSMKGTSGYASNDDLQNYTFVGLPNNGTIELPINQTSEGENYLVGNPYPSAIDADSFIWDNITNDPSSSSFNGSLYFWDHFAKTDHYLEHYIGGYAVLNISGSVEPASSVDSRIDNSDPSRTGSRRPGDYIPVGQAFFVNTVTAYTGSGVETTGGNTIKFKNSQRIYKREGIDKSNGQDQVIFFSANKKTLNTSTSSENKVEQQRKIWLKFKSPAGYHRQILVTADNRSTNGFDLGFDAPLIDNNKEDMYWLMGKSELVIQGVPDFNLERILPLGIKTAEGGKFIITIDGLENVDTNFPIYVKDIEKDTYHNLQESDFTAKVEKGNLHERYAIVFSNKEDPEDPGDGEGDLDNGDGDGDGVIVIDKPEQPLPTPPGLELLYSSKDKEVVIKNPELSPVKKAVLYSSLGQEIYTYRNIQVKTVIELPVDLPAAGMYILRVYTEDSTQALKFLVD
ncbi:HYR domain-containing protein [Salinimicrobium sp. HB62]|uniref:HYR domain-containing protein n=1 Tax=Salinimicrobium sp. HB62 TaxID=3077781 RepID=UPI002D77F773|nr:HYR domain-containing protein [Salinimicrobium sp. HB62]